MINTIPYKLNCVGCVQTMAEKENPKESQGFVLMSPDVYPIVEKTAIDTEFRYHHIVSLGMILQDAPTHDFIPNFDRYNIFDDNDSRFLRQAHQELLSKSHAVLTDQQRLSLSHKASHKYVMRLKENVKHDLRTADYIGKDGEFADMYEKELSEIVYKVLSMPPESKIQFSFSATADQMCHIGVTTKGPMIHCEGTQDPQQADYVTWLALNKTVHEWTMDPSLFPTLNKDDIGLVLVSPDLYDIFTTAKALKTKDFLFMVFENTLMNRRPFRHAQE